MATIGDSGAPSTNTIYYDALLSTTLAAYRKTMVDNIFLDSAFLAWLRLSDAIERQNGGERIAQPLMFGQNDTVETHGGYSIIDTTPQEGMTQGFFPWAEVAGTISISRLEQRQNAGEGKLLDLLKKKMVQAEMTMTEKLNTDIVQGTVSSATFVPDTADNGAYGIQPLGYFLRKLNRTDPTTQNVGNIAAADEAWWRARAANIGAGGTQTGNDFALNATTYAGLKVALRRMYNTCGLGTGGSPNVVLMDQVSYETYENALDVNIRFPNTKMGDLGFSSLKLSGATVLFDEKVPDVQTGTTAITKGSAFFINTKFYKLVIDSETDIVTTPFIEPENQTAKTAKILFMGNTTISNPRKCGVAYDILQTIVA